MIVLIDNYDSFTYNLVHYFPEIGQIVKVFRNGQLSAESLKNLNLTLLSFHLDQVHQKIQVSA